MFVSECQAALTDDVVEFFATVVKEGLPYKHNSPEFSDCNRRNAAAHLRALLLGQSVLVPVVEGKPVLGQFQSIMLRSSMDLANVSYMFRFSASR